MIIENAHLKTIEFTYHDFKLLYEYFEQQKNREGLSHKFSWLLLANLQYMKDNNEVIDKKIQAAFAQHSEYATRLNILKEKYADRGSQGEIIMNGDEPSITEQVIEFNEEVDALNKEMPNCAGEFDVMSFLEANKIEQEMYLFDSFDLYPQQLPPIVLLVLNQIV